MAKGNKEVLTKWEKMVLDLWFVANCNNQKMPSDIMAIYQKWDKVTTEKLKKLKRKAKREEKYECF